MRVKRPDQIPEYDDLRDRDERALDTAVYDTPPFPPSSAAMPETAAERTAMGERADRTAVAERAGREEQDLRDDRTKDVLRPAWSPAQLVSMGVGILSLAVGGLALARTGIDLSHVAPKQADVLDLPHTQLLGGIEVVIGAILLAAGAKPGGARSLMAIVGALGIAAGIIAVAQPTVARNELGTTSGLGWSAIVLGAVLLLAAAISPVYGRSERRHQARHHRMGRHTHAGLH